MYKAKKPCHFQGQDFMIGDPIPEGIFEKSRVSALVKWGMIEKVDGEAPKAEPKAEEESVHVVEDTAQAVWNAPESTGTTETEESVDEPKKAPKTGRRGGRKKAGA